MCKQLSNEHEKLNELCQACGKYGFVSCAICPVEIRRQQEVITQMNGKTNIEHQNDRFLEYVYWERISTISEPP